MKQPWEDLIRSELQDDLDTNIDSFKKILNSEVNSDAKFRDYVVCGHKICVLYIEGMADDKKISEFVLHACANFHTDENNHFGPEFLMKHIVEIAQCETECCVEEILKKLVSGMSVILMEGHSIAVIMETRGFPSRQVNQTTNESVVIGAQEGFVESLRTNITLVRRYVQSPHLITESLSVGTKIPSRVSLIYLNGVADEKIVSEVRRRLLSIKAPTVQGVGAIQQLIEDNPYSLLPQMLQTERPDRTASCIMDGLMAILADNSPYAIIAPITIFHQIHASDDSFSRWQYGTFLRLIRIAGILISVLLPGMYIALTVYHMHLLPMSFLTSIAESRANVPFPILVEILIMEFSFYLINEAGTRIPQQIGSALGIVGALILGQAAVSASIISPILIIIVALTGLGNYAVPDYGFSLGLVIYRLFVIFCGAILGLYGICIAVFCLVVRICSLKSVGVPYVAPVAPPRPHNPDIFVRLPLWMQRHVMFYAKPGSWIRQKEDKQS